VLLVIDVTGMYASAGAVLHGFLNYKPNSGICGVVFNGASAALYEGLKRIAEDAGVMPLGYLPHAPDCALKSRHLGLVTPDEYADMQQKLRDLGELALKHFDIAGIHALAARASEIREQPMLVSLVSHVRIAVARDEACCFLYQENIELLEALGAQITYFSPLRDAALPENIGGLYLCGGYPELYGTELYKNEAMRRSIREAIESGIPAIAECGGFLYLHDTLNGLPMAGVIHANAYNTGKLTRFGYAELTAQKDNLLCDAGGTIRAHEFHYYDSDDCGNGFYARKPTGERAWTCAYATDTLYAGFPHLYFYANSSFAERFIRKAAQYADSKRT
jgi:cobyrinic acid a,c-diamide synthase